MMSLELSKLLSGIGIVLVVVLSSMCQCAPAPERTRMRDRGVRELFWNPYYYPTVRSLQVAPLYPRMRSESSVAYKVAPAPTSPVPDLPKNINRRAIQRTASSNSIQATTTTSSQNQTNNFASFLKSLQNFNPGNFTAMALALNEFIRSAESILRDTLTTSQTSLLRVIGRIDQESARFQKLLQGQVVSLVLSQQMASAMIYDALPPYFKRLIKRLGTPTDSLGKDFNTQLIETFGNFRRMKKMLREAIADHEVDFHNVFQERFTQINKYLGVPELPKRPFGWVERSDDDVEV